MNTKRLCSAAGILLSVLCMLFWMMSGCLIQASAAAEGTLTMYCRTNDNQILAGMHWDIYRVGYRAEDGSYVLEGDFADYPVSLEDTSASALSVAAETLETYAVIDEIAPFASADADEDGYLKFSGMDTGLYLVCGDFIQIEDTYYFPSAFLVEIPAEGGDQNVDLMAYPKYISMNAGEGGWDYTVKKVWANDELEPQNRSTYITVEIYRNDVLYETVRLDESNDWTYEWSATNLYEWRVVEVEVPVGYYVVYRSNETQYVIVNTYMDSSSITESIPSTDSVVTETNVETEVTDTTSATTVTESEASETQNSTGVTTVTTVTTTGTSSETERLPQTGQLWWPVPVLGIAGLLSIAIGLRMRAKE